MFNGEKQNNNLRQKKSLSQVFLKTRWSQELLCKTLDSWQSKSVLEIGPGGGALTKFLCERDSRLTCVEKDTRFAENLPSIVGDAVEVLNVDFLKFDLETWVASTASNSHPSIVGNIPYQISTDILMKTLPLMSKLRGMILMTQLEYASRICANPGSKIYGSLSVFAQLRCAPVILARINRGDFHPKPKVHSALIAFEPLAEPYSTEDLALSEKICRRAFSQRRKQIRGTLKEFAFPSETQETIDFSSRPEQLSPAQFLFLARSLKNP